MGQQMINVEKPTKREKQDRQIEKESKTGRDSEHEKERK
jgi:hypothetical protein